jgi:hypothetical protein
MDNGSIVGWQIKRIANRSFTVSVKTPKGTEGKATLKDTAALARLRG